MTIAVQRAWHGHTGSSLMTAVLVSRVVLPTFGNPVSINMTLFFLDKQNIRAGRQANGAIGRKQMMMIVAGAQD